MNQESKVDISEFIQLLNQCNQKTQNPISTDSGFFYNNEIPEDIYHEIIYQAAPAPESKQKQTLLNQNQNISSVSDLFSAQQQNRAQNKSTRQPISPYDFKSVYEIPSDKKLLATFDSQIQNAIIKTLPEMKTLKMTGTTTLFNNKFNGIKSNIKHPLPTLFTLPKEEPIDKDPYIQELLKTPSEKSLRIFANASAIAAIGVCQRSTFPFSFTFEKINEKDVIVKNETGTQETYLESITTIAQVQRDKITQEFYHNMFEATIVNEEFKKKVTEEMEPIQLSPDSNADENSAYIYRLIEYEDIEIIVRGKIDCLKEPLQPRKPPSACICRTFVDIPTILRKNPWENLETKRGIIFLNETNVNSAKVARWVASAILTGVDNCLIGYVIRKSPNTAEPHSLLGVVTHNTDKFAREISLKQSNMFAIIHDIFQPLITLPSSEYSFLKEPKLKRTFGIYQTTEETSQGTTWFKPKVENKQ